MIRCIVEKNLTDRYTIEDKENLRHLKTVLKVKTGEHILLVKDFEVGEYEIIEISEVINLNKIKQWNENNELLIDVDLVLSPLKKNNTELVIQKAVELGVCDILITNFRRSVAKYENNPKKIKSKLEKFDKIIIGAMEQSRRNQKSNIAIIESLKEIEYHRYNMIFLCYENEDEKNMFDYLKEIKNSKKILIIIGPEGGIAEEELQFLDNKVKIISLGKRILRAETAAINSLSIIGAIIEQG